MRWRYHVYRGISVLDTDDFAPGMPAGVEGCELRFVTHGLLSGPPGFELLGPALRVWGAADADVSAQTVVCPCDGIVISFVCRANPLRVSWCGAINQPLERYYRLL
jgi:hypothetical protein